MLPDVEPRGAAAGGSSSTGDGVDVCDVDPGHPPRATAEAGLRTLTRLWRGDVDWATVLRSGELVLRGDSQACRALPRWLALTDLARTPRPFPRGLHLV